MKQNAEEKPLEESIVEILIQKKWKITTVESCTAGLVSARLTEVPGVSKVFKQGFVTYSDKAKRKLVGVKKETLKTYTAVSEQTAFEMARGGAIQAEAEVCVSVTGYAGPEGGEDGSPVGLVYLACYVNGEIKVEKCQFKGNRQEIRKQAVQAALLLLYQCISEKN